MNEFFEEYYDFSVKENVRRAFETSLLIQGEFESNYLKTAHLLLGFIKSGDTAISHYFMDFGMVLSAETIVSSLLKTPAFFEDVFGEEEVKKFFYSTEEELEREEKEKNEKEKDKKAAISKKGKEPKIPLEDYIKNVVNKAIAEQKVQDELEEEVKNYIPDLEIYYSKDLADVLNETLSRLTSNNIDVVDANNLLYTMAKKPECSAYKLLNALMRIAQTDMEDFISFLETEFEIINKTTEDNMAIPSALESCCEIFNNRFKKGEISDILGRDKEKKQLWNIFSKKTKRNAILVGDAGVGKTAIIEAITQDIINETCPKRFYGYTVLSFSVEASVAGTKYRGEFEQKISTLKKFLEDTKDVILFIDEIHATVGAGSAEGNANDLSGSLKSLLARGDVIVVGTTTNEEYDRFIARDTAYKRRFERVNVREPKYSEVKKMIKLKIENLENFHGVKMSDNVLNYIITTSACFASTSSNPDKTLDLCDRAMSLAESENASKVTKKHVRNVFEDSYEKYKKFGDETNKLTAYHEAAHYVVGKATGLEEKENVIAISILPSNESLGVNVIERDERVVNYDKKDFLDKITMLLAGRAVEVTHFKKLGTGAESDILQATMIAKSMLTRNSLAFFKDEQILPSLFTYDGIPTLELDENSKERINNEVTKILNEQFEDAKDFVKAYFKKIEAVANALLSNYVLTREELDKIYSSTL